MTNYNTMSAGDGGRPAEMTSKTPEKTRSDSVGAVYNKPWVWKLLDFVNVFTIFVGVNFLGLPYTISRVGILPAVLIMCCIVLVTYHGCSLLLICKQKIDERKLCDSTESIHVGTDKPVKIGYAALAGDAFGPVGESVVTISIFVIHFCFCTGYFIYLGNSMESLAEEFQRSRICSQPENFVTRQLEAAELPEDLLLNRLWTNGSEFAVVPYKRVKNGVEFECDFRPEDAPKFNHLVWIMSPFVVILCLPNFQILQDFLNIFQFITVIFVYFCLSGWLVGESLESNFKPSTTVFIPEGLLFTFGQASSTLEGMGQITEVYDNLYEDHSYVRSYLAKTFAIALPAYLTLGILGYVVLGNRVEQVITQNLGVDQEFELVINFLVVCMILFGYPGMAYPGQKVLEQWCYKILTSGCYKRQKITPKSQQPESTDDSSAVNPSNEVTKLEKREQHIWASKTSKLVSRVSFVLATVALSTMFQSSFIFISAFTGAMDNCLLSLIFPAAIHTKLMMGDGSSGQGTHGMGRRGTQVKNGLMMVFGLCLACVSLISFSLIDTQVKLV